MERLSGNKLDVSLVTIAFNGYGRFLGQFLAFASNISPKPNEVVVVLGHNHGCNDLELMKCIYPGVKVVHYTKKKPTFGKLRNIGIAHTKSEWTWFVSVDDKPMPDAIETFDRALNNAPTPNIYNARTDDAVKTILDEYNMLQDEDRSYKADYICAQWNTIGLGEPLKPHYSPTPQEMVELLHSGQKGGFIIPHSPFKRSLWEQHAYVNTDLPNYDFLLHCVLNGAKFTKGDKPTTTYLRRPDSHARTKLRGIQKAANREKRKMQEGLIEYYGA